MSGTRFRFVINLDIDPEVATPQEIAEGMSGALDQIRLPCGDTLYLLDVKVDIEEVPE